jgi:hypothetical protein
MFAGIACAALIVIGVAATRMNEKDVPNERLDRALTEYVRHSRQDLRLIVYLLAAILGHARHHRRPPPLKTA